MTTRVIEKGMPIEQGQNILGHEQIDTTLGYYVKQVIMVRNLPKLA